MDNFSKTFYNLTMLLQFDLDTHSDHAALFSYLRKTILSYEEITEIKNAKQTTYKDSYSTVCMLRVRQGLVRLSFANGARLQKQFSELRGDSKIVKHLEFQTIEEVDNLTIKTMLEESLLLNIEKYELKRLKCNAKHSL